MALVQCPGCKLFVSSKGRKCASCGHDLVEAAPAAQPPQQRYRPMTPSVGRCPECGSLDTFDHVAEAQRTASSSWLDSMAVSLGAKFRLAMSRQGRNFCTQCGHNWG
jgi:hypothetical protein